MITTKGDINMRTNIACRKIELTQGLKDYAERKADKLDKFFGAVGAGEFVSEIFGDEAEAKFVFSVEKDRQKAELTVFSLNTIYRVETVTEDMYSSIDKAITGMERQIRKNKTRLEKRLRSGALDAFNLPSEAENVAEEKEFSIVKKKTFNAKPMNSEEAVLQMNLLQHEFFVFLNSENDRPCIVYKRKDGNYGLIELA